MCQNGDWMGSMTDMNSDTLESLALLELGLYVLASYSSCHSKLVWITSTQKKNEGYLV